ncbi:small-conductance mechanosensitive channel MscS [soil metagenome]
MPVGQSPNNVDRWLDISLAAFGMNLLAAVLILVVGIVLAQLGAKAVRASVLRTPMRNRGLLVNFFARATSAVILVFAFVLALGALGLDVGPLIAGIGITGFIVGFAFKDSLSNLAAGLLLIFYQPFEVGDFVEIGGISGSVRDMSIAATELKMPDGRLAIVPNSRIWNAPIINFNRLGERRIEWAVGVAYGSDLNAALEALRGVITADERILSEPAPHFVVNGLGESSVDLVVRAWVRPANFLAVTSDTRRALLDGLAAAGVSIPFPHRVLVQASTDSD